VTIAPDLSTNAHVARVYVASTPTSQTIAARGLC